MDFVSKSWGVYFCWGMGVQWRGLSLIIYVIYGLDMHITNSF